MSATISYPWRAVIYDLLKDRPDPLKEQVLKASVGGVIQRTALIKLANYPTVSNTTLLADFTTNERRVTPTVTLRHRWVTWLNWRNSRAWLTPTMRDAMSASLSMSDSVWTRAPAAGARQALISTRFTTRLTGRSLNWSLHPATSSWRPTGVWEHDVAERRRKLSDIAYKKTAGLGDKQAVGSIS